MKIEHVALWTRDIERSRLFYERYFGAKAKTKYVSASHEFESYFLSFESGARLEIMQMPDIADKADVQTIGWIHIAISTGSKEAVDSLTERLRKDGYSIASEARTTGDGYYESVVLDPDGNRVEITV